MAAAASSVWMYGDPKSHMLRSALADHHGVNMANIVVGEGVDGLLAYASALLIAPGDALVTSHGTYPTLNYFVAGRGGTLHTVPYNASDDRQDLDALLAKAREVDAKVLYVVNPCNPSGTWHSAARLEALVEALPPGCLLLLDEVCSYYPITRHTYQLQHHNPATSYDSATSSPLTHRSSLIFTPSHLQPEPRHLLHQAYHELGVEFDANAKVAVDDLRVLRL
eukprot:3629257-Prymnesium_polylepis.1